MCLVIIFWSFELGSVVPSFRGNKKAGFAITEMTTARLLITIDFCNIFHSENIIVSRSLQWNFNVNCDKGNYLYYYLRLTIRSKMNKEKIKHKLFQSLLHYYRYYISFFIWTNFRRIFRYLQCKRAINCITVSIKKQILIEQKHSIHGVTFWNEKWMKRLIDWHDPWAMKIFCFR